MKLIFRLIIEFLMLVLIVYLVMAFNRWDFNPAHFTKEEREQLLGVALTILLAYKFIFGFEYGE